MTTPPVRTLSDQARLIIDHYRALPIGAGVCDVPYFNNKTVRARGALSVYVGKGSPSAIAEEAQALLVKHHASAGMLSAEALKKFLVENNLGIDCSGFAYHVLNAELVSRGRETLAKKLYFVSGQGLLARLRCSLRPAENCDVASLADEHNSQIVSISAVAPGDMITMLKGPEGSERDHILIVDRVETSPDGQPVLIHYCHTVAYPEDGLYGTGFKEGSITVTNPQAGLLDQVWQSADAGRLLARAKASETSLRRLNWL